MPNNAPPLAPTAMLRWVLRTPDPGVVKESMWLQQWWAQDVPDYMKDRRVGEWRDVPVYGDEQT